MKKQLRMSGMSRKQLFLLFGFFLISTLSVSAQKYFELHDAYNNRSALIPDVLYYNETYHEYANGRLGAQWKFELVADSFYTITDRKHGKLLATNPNVDDTQTYHYEATNGDHAQWCLVDVDGRGVLFLLKNKKYNKKFLACWSVGNGNGELLIQDTIGAVKKKCASWRLIEKYGTGNMPKDVKGREVKATSELVYNTNNNTTVSIYNLPRTLCGDVLGNQLIQGLPGSPPNDMTFMNSIPREKYGAMDQTREGTQSGKDYLISIYVNSPNRIDHTNNYVDLIDPTNNNWAGEKTRDSLKLVRRGDAYIVNYGWKGFYLGEYKLNTVPKDDTLAFGTASLLSRFFIQEQNINNGTPLNNTRLQIPFQVSGIVDHEVPILGFTTEPQVPYLVLHDPPGDGSTSSFSKTKTICNDFENSYTVDKSANIHAAVKLGVSGSVGLIATVDYEFSVEFNGSVTSGDLVVKTSANSNCISTTQGFTTSDLEPVGEGGSDVFIGFGYDMNYGKYREVDFVPDSCKAVINERLIYSLKGSGQDAFRKFVLTEGGIRNDIESLYADTLNADQRVRANAKYQINAWERVLAANDSIIANASETIGQPLKINGGGQSVVWSEDITVTQTNTLQTEHYLQGTFGMETVVDIGGTGGSFGFNYTNEKRYGATNTNSQGDAEVVSYTLKDDDSDDQFYVDVFRDGRYGTPLFRLTGATETSCPYEGGYQIDQPLLKINGQDENVIILSGIPDDEVAMFKLDLINESKQERTYRVKLNEDSNPDGAIVTLASEPISGSNYHETTIPANSIKEDRVIRISKASGVSAYENLEIYMFPECNSDISSSIFVSVYFMTTAVEEAESPVSQLEIFPNPASDEISVVFNLEEQADAQFVMYDMVGNRTMLVSSKNFSAGTHREELNVEQVPSGIYQLAIKTDKSVISRKVIVQH